MAELRLTGIEKHFGATAVLRGVDLTVGDGEALAIVGPSGCGKTTVLRIAAGLDDASGGTVHIGDRDVTTLPPGARNVAMAFQHGALYPHLTVAENIGFGLTVRKVARAEVVARVTEVASLVGCTELLDRRPAGLSGGERQRIALARALVRRPDVLLLDEPMASLDVPSREQLRSELQRLHRALDTTMVLVTHDQAEALAIGDRVAVLRDGVVQQAAPPDDLYWQPANRSVAALFGGRAMNVFPGEVIDGEVCVGPFRLPAPGPGPGQVAVGTGPVAVGVRPEHLALTGADGAEGADAVVSGVVEFVEPAGGDSFVTIAVGAIAVVARVASDRQPRVGDRVGVVLPPHRIYLFDAASGRTLAHPGAGAGGPGGPGGPGHG